MEVLYGFPHPFFVIRRAVRGFSVFVSAFLVLIKMNFQYFSVFVPIAFFIWRIWKRIIRVQESGGIFSGAYCRCSDVRSFEEKVPVVQMELASDCISSEILHNHLILKTIFRYLDLKNLKSARLVCLNWSREAARHFSHTDPVIRIGTWSHNSNNCELKELSTYLFRHGIQHSCFLSFLKESRAFKHYVACGILEKTIITFYSAINTHFSDIFDHLKLTGGLIRKMRLEMVLMVEEDTKLLSLVLTSSNNLETLEMDLVQYQIDGFICPILQDLSFPAIQTLGLRFHNSQEKYTISNNTLSVAALVHLLKVFTNVQRLDLLMWRQHPTIFLNPQADIMCLEAVSLLHAENPEYLCRLSRLRVAFTDHPFQEMAPKWRHVENFSKPLVSLECSIMETDEDDLENFKAVLIRHSATMKLLDFGFESIHFHSKISLPYLPNLTTINFGTLELDLARLPPGYLDVLSLREIFLEGESELGKTLPSLTTLSIVLYCETGLNIWHHIFPDVDKNGIPLEIKQIKFLTVTISSECEDSEISRFHKIFPKLNYLRHTRREIHRVHRNRDDVLGHVFNWRREEIEQHVLGCEHFKVDDVFRKSSFRTSKWLENVRSGLLPDYFQDYNNYPDNELKIVWV